LDEQCQEIFSLAEFFIFVFFFHVELFGGRGGMAAGDLSKGGGVG
jgi:hypothetical protein